MAAPPKINATVLAVRWAWEGINSRRAARKAPGGGRAQPMTMERRHDVYQAQNPPGMRKYTRAQFRRRNHKLMGAIARGIASPEGVLF